MKNTCPSDICTFTQKRNNYLLYGKLYVYNTLLACPIRATVIFWSFKHACPNLTFTCPRQSDKCICSTLDSTQDCITIQSSV